ncbi:hypothetical protein [Anabaena sp. UHCC 0399]|nr:hypothetical protein [Anabaena sp. UHCC 0399]MEA5567329.1 hypothetical protein [Anabaena sp. UHCC 0399]
MKNQHTKTYPQPLNSKKIPQLQLLDLEQLDSVIGAAGYIKIGDIKGECR